jgi:rubrerythrin
LLSGQGFKEVYNLKGGVKAWQGQRAVGPEEIGMDFFRDDETAEKIIILAYGLEDGLKGLYRSMAEKTDDQEVVDLLSKLAAIEENHKQRLFRLYLTLDPAATDRETFEADIMSDAMEGGFTTEEFLEQNRPAMQTTADVLNVAMMIETQALDLYLRYSQKSKEEKSKTVLREIADEEKAHLAALGRLMEAKG